MTDVDGRTRAGAFASWTVLVVCAGLGIAGFVRPFYAAIPGLVAMLLAYLVHRRQRATGRISTLVIVAFAIGGLTFLLGLLWFGIGLIVSGPAVFRS